MLFSLWKRLLCYANQNFYILTGSYSLFNSFTGKRIEKTIRTGKNIEILVCVAKEALPKREEQNQTPLLHSPHLTQKKLKTILCPVLILADTGDFIKRERSTLKKKVLFQQYDQLTKQYL